LYKDPTGYKVNREYDEGLVSHVCIKSASYVILNGMYNDGIVKTSIYTQILELNELQKIADIANKKDTNYERVLTKEKPYVKQIKFNKTI
jgi:hypothetical protein